MKKVIYILNLLFLTLSVFGGSVFAADQYYFKGDGTVGTIPAGASTLTASGSGSVATGDYTVSSLSGGYYLNPGAKVNLYITRNINASSAFFNVPMTSTLNLYSGAPNATTQYSSQVAKTITIQNSNNYTIGNISNGPENGIFGTINFNSGIYTVKNNAATSSAGIPIGSPNTSGGTITVNAAANVTAQLTGGDYKNVSIGVLNNNQCNIIVNGGILTASANGPLGQINVGSEGTFEINDGGYVKCGTEDTSLTPENIADEFVTLNSGVLNWYQYPVSATGGYFVNVGGDVTFPLANDAGLNIGYSSYPGTVVFEEGSNVQIGTSDDPFGDFASPDGTEFYNYGDVEIVNVPAPPSHGVGGGANEWTNEPGSSLVVNDGQTLWANTINGSETTTTPSSSLTLNGLINGYLTNYSNLTINSDGPTNVAGVYGPLTNADTGTATLDGTLNITNAGNNFQNSGTLNIGPIGTVEGNLTNNEGDTVTSENPCYHGNQVYSVVSVNPFVPYSV